LGKENDAQGTHARTSDPGPTAMAQSTSTSCLPPTTRILASVSKYGQIEENQDNLNFLFSRSPGGVYLTPGILQDESSSLLDGMLQNNFINKVGEHASSLIYMLQPILLTFCQHPKYRRIQNLNVAIVLRTWHRVQYTDIWGTLLFPKF